MIRFDWTAAAEASLRKAIAGGASFTDCAVLLSEEFGGMPTKGMIAGKVDRLGLRGTPRRATRSAEPAVVARKVWRRAAPSPDKDRRPDRSGYRLVRNHGKSVIPPAPEPLIPDIPPDQSPDACTLLELTPESCRWPMGTPGTEAFRYCGTSHDPACGSYCARHRALAYGKPMAISEEERQRRVTQAQFNYRKRMAG